MPEKSIVIYEDAIVHLINDTSCNFCDFENTVVSDEDAKLILLVAHMFQKSTDTVESDAVEQAERDVNYSALKGGA